jgi:uncharacterized cupin superfamily protein
MHEARITETDVGKVAEGDGWFIANVADVGWERSPNHGAWCAFEAHDARSTLFGIGVHVLQPGEPNGLYHSESNQEDFLVLAGECLAIVEGEERRMRQWDFLHCPPGTAHIFVGAGDGPCVILMAGARSEDEGLHYPLSELAAHYGASAEETTSDPNQAYAGFEPSRRARPSYWDRLPRA